MPGSASVTGLVGSPTLGRIYSISAPGISEVYVGSTRGTLDARMLEHHRTMRAWQRGKTHYVTSFSILAHTDARIELLEEAVYDSADRMREREGYWVGQLPSVNKCMPGRRPRESHRVYRATKVACPTCGKCVRRDSRKDHSLSMRCVAALQRSAGSVGVAAVPAHEPSAHAP
jgi:hypothetical protein